MQTVVIVIHLMIVLAMIGVVLLQKSEGGGLGMGGGAGFMSSRGSANILTRTTALLALGFFFTSLVLSVLASLDRKPQSILQNAGGTGPAPATAPASGAPRPLEQGGGGLLNTLGGQAAPGAPAAPAEGGGQPQVPRSQ